MLVTIIFLLLDIHFYAIALVVQSHFISFHAVVVVVALYEYYEECCEALCPLSCSFFFIGDDSGFLVYIAYLLVVPLLFSYILPCFRLVSSVSVCMRDEQ